MEIKSVLKPEGSIASGAATAGLVYAIYQMHMGSVADCHVTDPNHPCLQSSLKKAGWISLATVAAISLITRDGNVFVLGAGTVLVMEVSYRHAVMSNPMTQMMERPIGDLYQPAAAVVPQQMQGETSYDSGVPYAA